MSDEQLVKSVWSMNEKDLTRDEVDMLFEDPIS